MYTFSDPLKTNYFERKTREYYFQPGKSLDFELSSFKGQTDCVYFPTGSLSLQNENRWGGRRFWRSISKTETIFYTLKTTII